MKINERTLAYKCSEIIDLNEFKSISGGNGTVNMTNQVTNQAVVLSGQKIAKIDYKWDW